jgi:hypothetical protein
MKGKFRKQMRWFSLLLIIFGCSGFLLHPFYLSVTELKYNSEEGRLQVSVKMFLNDFENALKKIQNQKIDLIHSADTAKLKSQLTEYLQQRLQIRCDNRPIALNLLGYEREEENFWIYCESGKLPKPKKLAVSNGLLYDFLKEQMNITRAKIGETEKSVKNRNPTKEVSFSF